MDELTFTHNYIDFEKQIKQIISKTSLPLIAKQAILEKICNEMKIVIQRQLSQKPKETSAQVSQAQAE